MIKRIVIAMLFLCLLVAPAYAGVTGGAKQIFRNLVIDDTDKHYSTDESAASNGLGEFYIGDKTKVGFFVE